MNLSDCDQDKARLLSESEALDILLSETAAITTIEELATDLALGRVLAHTLTAPIDVPAFDNSAMDGYAVNSRDIAAEGEICLPVSQRIAAGHPGTALAPGTAARIFTGAPLPPNADAVVMQEQCRAVDGKVYLRGPIRSGLHVRPAGEDIRQGSDVLAAGTHMRPQEMGLAASLGIARLPVFRRIRVAVLVTGDELLEPGEPPAPGKIYDSNRYLLTGLLKTLGCQIIDPGIIPDCFDATVAALEQAAKEADLILGSGGVSVGEEDHVKTAIEHLGELALWRIAVKPGKPLTYGNIGGTPVMGLPGNPVSLLITFCLFARPLILRLQGRRRLTPTVIRARAAFERCNAIPRREYLRARMTIGTDGETTATLYPQQGSAVLSAACWADCLAIVPADSTISPGETIDIIPFNELFF